MTKQQRITATPVLTQLKTCTTFLLTIHLRSFVKMTFGTITYATWKEGKLIVEDFGWAGWRVVVPNKVY